MEKPVLQVKGPEILFSPNKSNRSSINDSGKLSRAVILFNARKSTHNLISPFFFLVKTMGDAYSDVLSLMIPFANTSSRIGHNLFFSSYDNLRGENENGLSLVTVSFITFST